MELDRRHFIVTTLGAAGGLLLAESDLLAFGKFAPTKDDILGPYYRPGAPKKTTLRDPKTKGTPLLMSGNIKDEEGEPIMGALIEIWQADDDGEYDNDPKHKPEEFRFRASLDAGKKGEYAYDTIVPAAYEIGPKMYRPKHIHYKLTAPGFRTLITQVYFKSEVPQGDWGHPSLVIDLKDERVKGEKVRVGVFDLVLARR
jgi:catechol 1,2-dioxygenase